jgi:hypothetical protein
MSGGSLNISKAPELSLQDVAFETMKERFFLTHPQVHCLYDNGIGRRLERVHGAVTPVPRPHSLHVRALSISESFVVNVLFRQTMCKVWFYDRTATPLPEASFQTAIEYADPRFPDCLISMIVRHLASIGVDPVFLPATFLSS